MGLQTFYDKWPHLLLWGGSRAARGKITVSGTANHLNYCVIFRVGYICTFYKCDRRVETHDIYYVVHLFARND
jgi:hypothetical protein